MDRKRMRVINVRYKKPTQNEAKHMKNLCEYPPGITIAGYKDRGYVYLLSEIAHREVNRVQPLRFSA